MFTFLPDGIRRYRNTKVRPGIDSFCVTLHSTSIVCGMTAGLETSERTFTPQVTVQLNSGGWRTVTTKKRMNEVAQELGLDFSVFQRGGEWWIDYNGTQTPFVDRSTFACNRRES